MPTDLPIARTRFDHLLHGVAFWSLTDAVWLGFEERGTQATTAAELEALTDELVALLTPTT